MKVLFLTDNFPPEVNAPATRTIEHCKAWHEAGVEVTVITSAPNFPRGKLYAGYKNKLYQTENMGGLRVVRVWTYMAPNEGFVKRIADYVSFAITSFFAGLFQKADVIVATSPQFFTAVAGFGLGLVKRRPWIFELRDLWPESIAAVGAMRRGRMIRLFERLELFLYRRATRIVVVTPAFERNLVTRGIASRKIHVVTNGVDRASFPVLPKDRDLLGELGLAGKFVIGYVGTHGMAHGLDFVVRSAAKIQDGRIHFLFVGDGAEKANVLSLADELNLENVTFVDPVPKDQVRRYISIFNAALVPLRRSNTFLSVIPSKIFEAAAMEKPILLGVDGQAREIVEKHGAGLFFEPENEMAFLEAVERLSGSTALQDRLKAAGSSLAETYDRKQLAEKMLGILRESASCI